MFRKGRGMGETLKALIEEINYRDYISGLYKTPEAAFRRMENLDGFVDSIAHYESAEESPSLHGFLETMALTDLLKEKEEKSRGALPSYPSTRRKAWNFRWYSSRAWRRTSCRTRNRRTTDEDVEEERRLFYVGITRAMNELYHYPYGPQIEVRKGQGFCPFQVSR